MIRSLDTRSLEVFLSVCNAKSMTGAARILGVSQAAVSQQISRLETALKLRLVDRGNRELNLTPAGFYLRHHAQRVLDELASAERAMTVFKGFRVPSLTVGLMESTSDILAAAVLESLAGTVEKLDVRSNITLQWPEALLEGRFDLVIAAGKFAEPGIEHHNLVTEPLVLMLPKDFVGQAPTDLEDIAGRLPLVRLIPQRRASVLADRYLARQGIVLARVFEFDNTLLALDAVRRGVGWAVLSPLSLLRSGVDRADIDVYPLPPPVLTRTISLAAKADRLADIPRLVADRCRETLALRIDSALTKLAPRVTSLITVHRD